MNRRLLSLLTVGTLLASGASALAQTPPVAPAPPTGHRFFDEMDANKDGVVTRAEVSANIDKRFALLDADHNGTISQAERQAGRNKVRDKIFAERFAALDTDRNGQLSPAELRAGKEVARPDMDHADKGHGFGRPGRGGWSGGPDGGRDDGPQGRGFEGDVTKDAFAKRALTKFDLLDSNDDGKITAAERDAAAGQGGFPGHGRRGDKPRN